MKKIYLAILVFLLTWAPAAVHAQATLKGTGNSVEYLQGKGLYDDSVMDWFQDMRDFLYDNWDYFIYDAQGLACIFMLIFFSVKAYEMMAGDKQLEIMPLLRPFALMMVIMWWLPFCKVIAYPEAIVAAKMHNEFVNEQADLNNLRILRANWMEKTAVSFLTIQVETGTAASAVDQTNKDWVQKFGDWMTSQGDKFVNSVLNPIVEMKVHMETKLQLLVTQFMENIALWILRICVYGLFMLQLIYSTILIILGPFSVALSVLPAFRDSFTTWIARFISVNLYVGVAYLILNTVAYMQEFAMNSEITRYQALFDKTGILPNIEKFAVLAGNGYMSFGMVLVSFVVSAVAITTVPSVSTWIISTSGITSAASTAGRHGSALMSVASKAILKK